jgi:hypothetical protein
MSGICKGIKSDMERLSSEALDTAIDLNKEALANVLTKREVAAMAAMQGFLFNSQCIATEDVLSALSVKYADALLAELEKEKEV